MMYKLKLSETSINAILIALSNDYADNDLESRKIITRTLKSIKNQVYWEYK